MISIPKLSAVFNNTSATYKFYWFLAIINAVESQKSTIEKKEIFARMLACAWYTVNYFKVSFGKQDLIQKAIETVKQLESIPIDLRQEQIITILTNSTNLNTIRALHHFDKNVPHKFLSPWLGSGSKRDVYEKSKIDTYDAPYELHTDFITIKSDWVVFIQQNSGILKSFIYWHLSLFLQSRNPNVGGIPLKVIRPAKRGSLLKHKKDYWNIVLKELGYINCIYSGKRLSIGDYAVEHFLPYQYVVHDLMWNLVPADPIFNSIKRDRLPQFDTYFKPFYELQRTGLEIIKAKQPNNKFLEDFLPIFPDLKINSERYSQHVKPLLAVAHNNGFQYLKHG